MNNKYYSDHCSEEDREFALKLKGPVLIVGASGFIGAKLFFYLNKHRTDVFGSSPDPKSSWRLRECPWVDRCVSLDIGDERQLKEVIRDLKPETVFNLSAYGAYEHQREPAAIHRVNYLGVLNLINYLRNEGCCEAFIQAGSSSEYGLNCRAPSETGELRPNSDYAVSKASAALMIQYYGQIHNFPCQNLRLYSIYGPWEEPGRLIPALVSNGLQNKLPNFAAPEISRDFVYVDDCIGAFLRAAVMGCKEVPGASVNIASGKKTSIKEVAEITRRVFDIKDEPKFGTMPNRRWDLSDWYGDPSLSKKILNWTARTNFDQGLSWTADWSRETEPKVEIWRKQESKKAKISAIIACYKDHQAIPIMHKRLTEMFQKANVDFEIIFVNDRSPTEDEKVIRELCESDSHVIGISHSRNFGSQAAFYSGMGLATGDAVVLLDGDLQDPPEMIPNFIEKWNEGYEIVYGVRTKREASLYMQIFYKLFYRLFRKLSDISIPVDAGDFSLIDRRAVNQLLLMPEKDVFLRGLRAWVGFNQTGVPYIRPERAFGRSTNNLLKNIWWAKKGIFSFSTKPLSYLQAMGTVMFAVSVALALYYVTSHFVRPDLSPRGFTTIIILCLGIGGLQLLSIGVIGDYIGKILEETKNRPRFIRSAVFKRGEMYTSPFDIERFTADVKKAINGKHC